MDVFPFEDGSVLFQGGFGLFWGFLFWRTNGGLSRLLVAKLSQEFMFLMLLLVFVVVENVGWIRLADF